MHAARVPMTTKGPGYTPPPAAVGHLQAANDRARTAPIELILKISPSAFKSVIIDRWQRGARCANPVKIFVHRGLLFALVEWRDSVEYQDLVLPLETDAWEV